MAIDIEYDEVRGNPAAPECFLSVAVAEDFYRATRRAMPYTDPADGDVNFKVVPSAFLEKVVRKAPVDNPSV